MVISYEKKEIPVYGEFDTVVIGGGTAGAVAAISALKEGLSTLVVDSNGGLGGLQTVGLVSPIMGFFMNGVQPKSSIDQLIEEELKKINGMEPDYRENYIDFNPISTQLVMEKLVLKLGGRMLLRTACVDVVMDGAKLNYIIVHNKGGLQAIKAKNFIDCTGDADVCRLSGVETEHGAKSGYSQNTTLRFEMGGVDIDTYYAFKKTPQFQELLLFGYEKGLLREGPNGERWKGHQSFRIWGKPNCLAYNFPELPMSKDATNPDYITKMMVEGRQIIFELATFFCKYMPGFENAYLSQIANMLGVRESCRIKAEYVLTVDDVFDYKKFSDGIAVTNYHMDFHGGTMEDGLPLSRGYIDAPSEEQYFEVPFRSLIPVGVDNLLCAGRCAGGDFYAQSAFRIQHTCRYMGEAAGVGCRFAVEEGKAFRDIDGSKVRKVMADRGATYLAK